MKNFPGLLVFIALPCLIFSQTPTLSKGTLIDDDVYETLVKDMCKYNDGTIGLVKKSYKKKNSDEGDYFIEQFDANLNRISSKPFKTPVLGGGEPTVFNVHAQGDHFCVFWNEKLKKSDKATLYYSLLNTDGSMANIRKVSDIDVSDDYFNKWATYLSADNKTWAIKKVIQKEKKPDIRFEIECFNPALELQWKHEYAPFKDSPTSIIGDLSIGKDGYMAMLVNDCNINKQVEKIINQELWICDEKGKPTVLPISTPKGFAITGARFHFTENRINIFGMYADVDQKKKIMNAADYGAIGTFHISIDKVDYKVSEQNFTPFPKEVFEYFIAKEKDFEDGIIGLFVDDLVELGLETTFLILDKTNGSVYLSGNKYHNSISSSSGIAIPYQNGKPQKHVLIPKAMHSDDSYSGMGLLTQKTGETIHILYNDGPKNRNLPLSAELEEFGESPMSTTNGLVKKKADVMCITLNGNEIPRKRFLLGYKENDVFLSHLFSLPLDEKSFVFITGVDGKYQLNRFANDK